MCIRDRDKIPLTTRRLSAYGLKMGKVWAVSSASEAAEEARPVSYTHLDVYKRQDGNIIQLFSQRKCIAK